MAAEGSSFRHGFSVDTIPSTERVLANRMVVTVTHEERPIFVQTRSSWHTRTWRFADIHRIQAIKCVHMQQGAHYYCLRIIDGWATSRREAAYL